MENKFNIGDKVIIESACIIIDNPICKIIEILDSQSYMVIDIEGCKWIVAENEMEYIEEETEDKKEYNELLEENEELRELLEIAKATIQMISELI